MSPSRYILSSFSLNLFPFICLFQFSSSGIFIWMNCVLCFILHMGDKPLVFRFQVNSVCVCVCVCVCVSNWESNFLVRYVVTEVFPHT